MADRRFSPFPCIQWENEINRPSFVRWRSVGDKDKQTNTKYKMTKANNSKTTKTKIGRQRQQGQDRYHKVITVFCTVLLIFVFFGETVVRCLAPKFTNIGLLAPKKTWYTHFASRHFVTLFCSNTFWRKTNINLSFRDCVKKEPIGNWVRFAFHIWE